MEDLIDLAEKKKRGRAPRFGIVSFPGAEPEPPEVATGKTEFSDGTSVARFAFRPSGATQSADMTTTTIVFGSAFKSFRG